MAKRKEFMVIDGITYRVYHDLYVNGKMCGASHYKHLDTCYARPSITKRAIFNEWEDFFRGIKHSKEYPSISYCYGSGVVSYNCNIFTYGADCDILMPDGWTRHASFYITPTRNEVTIYDF